MITRRIFTRSAASLIVGGVCLQLLTPAVGAREALADPALDEDLGEELPEEDETDDEPEDVEEPEDGTEGEEEAEDSGNHLGQRKTEITQDPSLIEEHDNGNHNGLVKPREDDKVRGVGFWANLSGQKQSTTKKSTAKSTGKKK